MTLYRVYMEAMLTVEVEAKSEQGAMRKAEAMRKRIPPLVVNGVEIHTDLALGEAPEAVECKEED